MREFWDFIKWAPFFSAAILVLMAFCVFGMAMTLRQGIQWGEYRERCEAAGGVFYKAKHASPVCLRPEAFVPVPPA